MPTLPLVGMVGNVGFHGVLMTEDIAGQSCIALGSGLGVVTRIR